MIIPSIDLQQGNAVQLIGGAALELDAGDPRPLAQTFALAGTVAVVDLDAALGKGDNTETIEALLELAPCRVGGGIRSVEAARRWLNAGAQKIVLGTAARPDVLRHLPPERTVAALDAVHGEVVVEGWTARTGESILDRMRALEGLVGGFLVTFVEREGRMGGTAQMDLIEALADAAGDAELVIAGGVTTVEEIAALDRIGVHAQVGMALYKGHMKLADALCAPLRSDRPDGLWPTVVCDERGVALGLAYSDLESVREAVARRQGVYHSRNRGLWIKGESSGATQELLGISLDCDRDTLRFVVRQQGAGFCHKDTWTCFGEDAGLSALSRTIASRVAQAPEGSYTRRLLDDPALLRAKLIEEAGELIDATEADHAAAELADVLYFALVAATARGASLAEAERHLDRRALRITRRPGDAKP